MENEKIYKAIRVNYKKKLLRDMKGILTLTNRRLLFVAKNFHIQALLADVSDYCLTTEETEEANFEIEISVRKARFQFYNGQSIFNEDNGEWLEVMDQLMMNPTTKIETTVTHCWDLHLSQPRLKEYAQKNVYCTKWLLDRDNYGVEENGVRMIRELHGIDVHILFGWTKILRERIPTHIAFVKEQLFVYQYDEEERNIVEVCSYSKEQHPDSLIIDAYFLLVLKENPAFFFYNPFFNERRREWKKMWKPIYHTIPLKNKEKKKKEKQKQKNRRVGM